jgi:tetratricopeptide (TPR) repeat protein
VSDITINLPDFDALWNYADPAASESSFGALLPEARTSGDAAYLGQLLTQVARAQGLQGKFDEAHSTLDEVTDLTGAAPLVRIRYLLERGRVLNTSGHAEASRPLFLEAWQLASSAGEEFHAADAAHMLGIVETPETQLGWSLRALELAERTRDPRTRGWLGPLYNNIGWTYHDLGRYDVALSYFQASLEWRRQEGKPKETRIAAWSVARGLRSLGRYAEALAMQRENLAQVESSGDPAGYIEEEIGECLLALGREEEARLHFAGAYQLLSQDARLVAHEDQRLKRLKDLAGQVASAKDP